MVDLEYHCDKLNHRVWTLWGATQNKIKGKQRQNVRTMVGMSLCVRETKRSCTGLLFTLHSRLRCFFWCLQGPIGEHSICPLHRSNSSIGTSPRHEHVVTLQYYNFTIRGSVVWSLAPPVYMSKHWAPNCSRWLCHWCVNGWMWHVVMKCFEWSKSTL